MHLDSANGLAYIHTLWGQPCGELLIFAWHSKEIHYLNHKIASNSIEYLNHRFKCEKNLLNVAASSNKGVPFGFPFLALACTDSLSTAVQAKQDALMIFQNLY